MNWKPADIALVKTIAGGSGGGGGGGVTPNVQATAETLPAGSEATVTRTGSNTNPVFHFGIPEGEPGNPGTPGAPGVKGDPGKDATINGKPAVTLAAGQNVTVTTGENGTVTISAAGGGGGEVYSTEEKVIGTWIDGKPLYRRVFLTKSPNSASAEKILSISNLSVITIGGYLEAASGYRPVNFPNDNSNYICTYQNTNDNGNIYMKAANSAYHSRDIKLILEYTKTTDQATLETESTNEEEA